MGLFSELCTVRDAETPLKDTWFYLRVQDKGLSPKHFNKLRGNKQKKKDEDTPATTDKWSTVVWTGIYASIMSSFAR